MERCAIVVHSVNGNCYIIATYLQELLIQRNVDARLYRVEDSDLHILANQSDAVNDFYEDIQALPVASSSSLQKSRMVILGSPTSFGNVSAEMKAFMDSTFDMCEDRSLAGKYFACFTSCPHSTSEGAFCLDSMIHYAQGMGMVHVPFGVRKELVAMNQPVSGIVHLAGLDNTIRPSVQLGAALEAYAETLAKLLN